MGMNDFAPFLKKYGCFVVRNVTPDRKKTIKIFQYPINYMQTRDLLQIPGVGEADIRASLLKGELRHKILANDIVVECSDIDLLQFNLDQRAFLRAAGVINGLDIGGGILTPAEHQVLRQLIHFIDEGPGDGFASGAFKEILPTASPFPTSTTWYTDVTLTQKIVEKLIVYNASKFPITITHNMYDTDGVTIVHTVEDMITYNGAFESTRVRTIS